MHWDLGQVNKMIGVVCELLECVLRIMWWVSTVKVCVVHAVDQVLDQQLTRPEDDMEEEKDDVRDKVTFLNSLEGLEGARKFMCQFGVEDQVQTEQYSLITQLEKE